MAQAFGTAARAAQPHSGITGTGPFFILWAGQLVSTIGSGITGIALGLHVYQTTGSATSFALIFLAGMLPRAVFSPVAGVLADRLDRRALMLAADLGAGLGVLAALVLAVTGNLTVGAIYLLTALGSACSTFRIPAYLASVGALVPKAHNGRVAGLVQLSDALGQVFAPVLATALVSAFQVQSVLLLDGLTFVVALGTLAAVRIPAGFDQTAAREPFLHAVRSGWAYLAARPGLMGLLIVFVVGNFFVGNAQALLTPLVLEFATERTLGMVLSLGGAGMLAGGIVMSLWGGGRCRIYTILGAYGLLGLGIMVMGLFASVPVVAAALFLAYFSLPFIIGGAQAVLTSKVSREVQGRVFSLRVTLVTLSFALAFATAGPLADQVFKPLMVPGGSLASTLGPVMGVGAGRGIGLMFVLLGALALLTAASGFLNPRLRRVEIELPDAN